MENKYLNNIPIKTVPNGDPLQNKNEDIDDIPKEDLPNRIILTDESTVKNKKQN